MRIILLFLLFGVMIGITLPVTSYGWEFGGFVRGDVFEYFVCDEYTIDANTALRSKCYDLKLYPIDRFEMDFGYVWLLYVEVIDDKELMRDIIIVDESFNVDSLNHRYIGNSIENTIFWMPTHASMTDIKLELGNIISDIPGTYDNAVVTDFSRGVESTQYTLSFDSGGTIIIREDLYLPVSINVDTKMHSFSMQLNSMYNVFEFYSVPIDYMDSDYSATISGTPYNETSVVPPNDIQENDLIYSDDVKSNDLYSDVSDGKDSDYSTIISDVLHNDTSIVSTNDAFVYGDETIEIPVDDSNDTLFVPKASVTDLNKVSDDDNVDDFFRWLNNIVSSFFESLF